MLFESVSFFLSFFLTQNLSIAFSFLIKNFLNRNSIEKVVMKEKVYFRKVLEKSKDKFTKYFVQLLCYMECIQPTPIESGRISKVLTGWLNEGLFMLMFVRNHTLLQFHIIGLAR